MLVNIIQNTISSFMSAGVAAAEVITTNLKMWLGFETSETLGREEVVNGDFATDLSSWDISGTNATHTVTYSNGSARYQSDSVTPQLNFDQTISNVEVGKIYQLSIDVTYTTGILKVSSIDPNLTALSEGLNVFNVVAATKTIRILRGANIVDALINSVSLKELTQITPDKSGKNNVGELFTGKALEFDGSNDYVNTTGFEMSGTSATFAFWIYPKDTAYQFVMDLDGTVRTILGLFNGGSGQVFAFFNFGFKQFGTPTQNQWQRVVFRVNATTVECYVDGVKSGSTLALTSSIDLSTVGNSVIGGRFDTSNTGNRFDGSLSDFQIYNAYWSTDDIAYDYANPQNLVTDRDGTSIGLSNLKGYWHLSEGAGSLAYDSSGEGNNGTITGATYEPAQPRIPQLGMMNWSKGSNLYSFSEDFENSDWNKNTGTTITNNYATSPNGDLTAARYVGTGFSGIYDTFTLTTNSYTLSFYVKSNTGQNQNCRLILDSVVSSNILVTTDWARISYTQNGSGNLGRTNGIFRDAGNSDVDILIWGAQLEESSSAGAYRLTDGGATLNSTVIPNPTIPTQDIFGNAVRDRLNSFNLDGSGYAEVADDADLDLGTGDFTIEAWVKFEFKNQGSSLNTIYSNGEEVNDTNTFSLVSDQNNKIGFYVNGASCFSTSTLSKDDWVHVVGTRIQGTNGVKLYINGNTTPEATTTNNNTVTNSFDKTIGRDTHSSRYYNNIISDVRVYSQALTSDEIENNYNAGLSAHTN